MPDGILAKNPEGRFGAGPPTLGHGTDNVTITRVLVSQRLRDPPAQACAGIAMRGTISMVPSMTVRCGQVSDSRCTALMVFPSRMQ